MNNHEAIIQHSLNVSSSKQAFSFSKSHRFAIKKRHNGQRMYTLPSTLNKKTCSFGSGDKINLTDRRVSAPPGAYQSYGGISSNKRVNTISFSQGRSDVKFGYFLNEVDNKKFLPSPNAYKNQVEHFSSKYGKMAVRLPTDIEIEIKKRKKSPGPGTYNVSAIEMKNVGNYKLSKFKNPSILKYHSPHSNRSNSSEKKSSKIGPGEYENRQCFGVSILSKFRKSIGQPFPKSNRQGLEDKNKLQTPGFKYNSFSQFG